MTEHPRRGDKDQLHYAEPQEPIDYEPYTRDFRIPTWKDTKGLIGQMPYRELGTARQTDKEVYWDAETARQEWDRLWTKVWLLVGHLSDVPTPDSFMKVDIGAESFLVVRGEGEQLHAIYNVCQHRGTQLVVKDFGKTNRFVCPFHHWEYSNTGKLLKIVDRETFRKEALCHDLNIPHLRTEVWRGWIFVNMDPNAQPLEQFLGAEFMAMQAPYDFEKCIRIRDIIQEWPVNWKNAHQAFTEGYHVQATHPQLNAANDAYHAQHDLCGNGHGRSIYQYMSPTPHALPVGDGLAEEHKIFLREAGVKEQDFPKHWSQVPGMVIEGKRRKKGGIDYSKFTESQLIDAWGFGYFPCTETFYYPEGFFVQHWRPHPTDTEKCIYQAQVYAVPGVGELPSFMAAENADLSGKKVLPRTYLETDDIVSTGPVIGQDRMLVPRLQRGMHSRGFRGAVFSEQEVRIRDFFAEYYLYMRGHKP